MALRLKLRKKPLHPSHLARSSSSSSSFPNPPPPPSNSDEPNPSSGPNPNPAPSKLSSYFSDILKPSPGPSRRIPTSPPPPPPPPSRSSSPSISFDELRRSLVSHRDAKPSSPSPSSTTISFQNLLKNNVISNPTPNPFRPGATGGGGGDKFFDSIRESLNKHGTGAPLPRRRTGEQFSLKSLISEPQKPPARPLSPRHLPESIFGKEARGRAEEEDNAALRTEFVRMYSPEELGEKLRKLRPEAARKGGEEWFSLAELNERLVKLRELEEKENEARMGGVHFRDLRESLVKLTVDEDKKRKAVTRKSGTAPIIA